MEYKINKSYFIKWYEWILQGASADIECDIEEIEEKTPKKSSLFFTGRILTGEVVLSSKLLLDIKLAAQKPGEYAKTQYENVLRNYGYDLTLLREDETILSEEEVIEESEEVLKYDTKNEVVQEKQIDQLSLF